MLSDVMSPDKDRLDKNRLGFISRFLHMGLLVCGLLAWASSEFVEDYEEGESLGFSFHSWLGMSVGFFLLLRIIYGIFGPDSVLFVNWVPYTKERINLVFEDFGTLLRFRLPEREIHIGISGLVQSFGLIVFTWMALTGSFLFFNITPGTEATGLVHFVMELHEIGESLIPIFIVLHVGAVVVHSIFGNPVWRRMF